MTVESALPLLESLKSSYLKGDVSNGSKLLDQLKVQLTTFTALPPFFANSLTAQKELLIAREVMEYAVLLSVKVKDQDMFERHYQQLSTFYTDTKHLLPVSQQEFPIMGLNLLRLLVQNRTAEFHTHLELLDPEVQQNLYIKHAIELEQYLMEGAYNKVIGARKDIPAESYTYFMDLLMLTVRDEIAHCVEKAYPALSLAAAKALMSFDTESNVREYANTRGWILVNDILQFEQEKQEPSAKDIPSHHMINQALGYAKELERIV
mmetsp:Transcript_1489/g.2139  ORF Transcript_1489/g.2139 Transcript_1489/m.2139 type:complete len:264 (+) Transcript_1489:90-881(+)|eukprot:CAMPEP_0196572078 /NCGR_PEP_ID=MMETSP1081-20130531/2190_1 /TAXON_ID=36882 /ORGANISM="Pyramimonas amylifera, Strain CCMP720" /LENGTH=263 /DNA_ID=CAMNT_0041889271 /DNA_START=90 /DNA_END=881 /DNA_ORIENTATION=+